MYPWNEKNHTVQTDAKGTSVAGLIIKKYVVSPVAAAIAAIHAAITCSATVATVVTTGFSTIAVPRNVTATAGGTAEDIKAVQVIVEGLDIGGSTITETLPVFTVDTAGTVVGSKAFKKVTKVTIPAMDGAGATVSIGTGSKLGLPSKLSFNSILLAVFNSVREVTAPTVTVSASALSSNTVTLDSSLNGSKVVILYV